LNDLIHHLFTFHKVQLSVFPEFISFLRGRKRILRIVIDDNGKSFNTPLFLKNGFHVNEVELFCSKQKNSFGSLVPQIVEGNEDNYSKVKMFSISKFKVELKDFEKAELYGDVEKAGEYLGYPICCIKNISNINILKEMWANFYLKDYTKMKNANLFTNRFPITWGGMSIIGELFPCSLTCKNAIEYGKGLHNDVKSFGYSKISETLISHAKTPIYIDPINGNITKIKDTQLKPIIFT